MSFGSDAGSNLNCRDMLKCPPLVAAEWVDAVVHYEAMFRRWSDNSSDSVYNGGGNDVNGQLMLMKA